MSKKASGVHAHNMSRGEQRPQTPPDMYMSCVHVHVMFGHSAPKEERRLRDHRLAPHELLDREARDGQHREPPVEQLVGAQLILAVGALLLRDAEWIEPVVAREALLDGSEPRPLVGVLLRDVLQVGCETGSEDQEKRGGAVEQPTIE